MKKQSIFIASIFLIFGSFSFAFEWGGLVSVGEELYNGQSESLFDFDTNSSELTVDGKLWLKTPFDDSGENYFIAEGTYNFQYSSIADESDNTHYLDVDLFKLALSKETGSGKIDFAFGRFSFSDVSSVVYTQNGDGFLAKLASEQFSISAYGAYTGLLNGRAVTMLSVGDDDSFDEDDDKLYQLSEKFAAVSLSASFPNIVGNHEATAEFFGAFRLEGDSYNRLYGTLALNGPVLSSLFYNVSGTLGYKNYSEGDISDVGFLVQGSATYYPEFKNSSAGVSAVYACKRFTGFTSQTAVNAQTELQYNGLLKAGVFGSIKPIEKLLVSASADAVCVYEELANNAENASGDFGFRGLQFEFSANWMPLFDVSFGFSLTQFLDTDKTGGDMSKTTFDIKASISF